MFPCLGGSTTLCFVKWYALNYYYVNDIQSVVLLHSFNNISKSLEYQIHISVFLLQVKFNPYYVTEVSRVYQSICRSKYTGSLGSWASDTVGLASIDKGWNSNTAHLIERPFVVLLIACILTAQPCTLHLTYMRFEILNPRIPAC